MFATNFRPEFFKHDFKRFIQNIKFECFVKSLTEELNTYNEPTEDELPF